MYRVPDAHYPHRKNIHLDSQELVALAQASRRRTLLEADKARREEEEKRDKQALYMETVWGVMFWGSIVIFVWVVIIPLVKLLRA